MKMKLGIVVVVGIMLALGACSGEDLPPVSSTVLLDKADTTVLGDEFSYPGAENPEITSSIVRLEAGAETGWHLHEAPMYAYILDGTLEVTYDVDGAMVTKTYHEGDAIMEGLDIPHMGKNLTNRPVSILVVNIGSSDLANSVPLDAPEQ
jgi:quercetin dioxygenase-like cupin family protein